MGFLPPTSGTIEVDGVVIKSHGNLFPFVGYVPQQPFLFQGSLLDNIVMGAPKEEIDFERIATLLETVELSSFVAHLPNGLQTSISHNSLGVSGGQKQRIALVRALYHQPQFLILDEVTNQLDEALETKILQFLKTYTKEENVAVLLVSHSAEIVKVCDRMYTISNQTITEITHE